MGYTFSSEKQGKMVLYKFNKIRYNIVISYINSNESNSFNTSMIDNVIGDSNLPHKNVQNYVPFSSIVTVQKIIDTESFFCIDD